jgi:hypothetical protein
MSVGHGTYRRSAPSDVGRKIQLHPSINGRGGSMSLARGGGNMSLGNSEFPTTIPLRGLSSGAVAEGTGKASLYA